MPHGGGIEQYTSDIARAVAGTEFSLYLFEGIRHTDNYAALHLSGHKFDEPRCLELLPHRNHVIARHGCRGDAQQALVGGLDEPLKAAMGQTIADLGVDSRCEATISGNRSEEYPPCRLGASGQGWKGAGPGSAIFMPLPSVLGYLASHRNCWPRS